jgi:hypothetical protein
MASVGGISCTFVKGEVNGLRLDTTVWRVPGINGFGAQTLGLGGSSFAFRSIVFGTAAQVDAWYRAIEALVGYAISIVDDWGLTHTGCLLTRTEIRPRRFRTNHDSLGACRGEMVIEGVKT